MWPFNRKVEERVASSDPFLGEFLGARWNGVADIDKASGHAVAFSCVNAIAGGLASVPLPLLQKTEDGGTQPATSHPLYEVLATSPDGYLTGFEFRERIIIDLLTYGNHYSKIVRNGRGQVTALHPMLPGMTWVDWLPNGKVKYRYNPLRGVPEVLLPEEVLHIRYRSQNGIWGVSPIQYAQATFGLALAQQDTAGASAENAFRPSGILSFPDKLSNTTGAGSKDDVITKFRTRFIGQLKSGDPLVLDGGATWSSISFNSKDSEFLASRQLSNQDVCRIFNVPPSVVGLAEHSNYGSQVEESRALVTRCLAPMAARVEASMNVSLLTPQSRQQFCIKHDLSQLSRGDMAARYAAYAIGKQNGWLSSNEIRHEENLSSIEGGDTYMQPLNMTAANDNKNTIDTTPAAPSDNKAAA